MNNKKETSFLEKHKWHFITFFILLTVGYVAIYFMFRGDGIIPAGKELSKNDWLSFLGSYLSFVGTVAVALVATLQNRYYTKQEENRRRAERKNQIQPIFSVKIAEINTQVDGTVEAIRPFKHPQIEHKNIKISIENVNQYPIKHLIVFEKYLSPLLKCNEIQYIQCAYSDSTDAEKWKDKLTILLESDYERNEKGIPMSFHICYEDVDGTSMYQIFELKEFEGTFYYSLKGIYEA